MFIFVKLQKGVFPFADRWFLGRTHKRNRVGLDILPREQGTARPPGAGGGRSANEDLWGWRRAPLPPSFMRGVPQCAHWGGGSIPGEDTLRSDYQRKQPLFYLFPHNRARDSPRPSGTPLASAGGEDSVPSASQIPILGDVCKGAPPHPPYRISIFSYILMDKRQLRANSPAHSSTTTGRVGAGMWTLAVSS